MNDNKKFVINTSIDCPCIKCKKRNLGCHSKCLDYAKYKKDLEVRVKDVKKQRTGGW